MVHTTVQGLVSICCLCIQIFGCETTSRLFGLGKGIVVKKLSDSHFYKCAEAFTKKECEQGGRHFRG